MRRKAIFPLAWTIGMALAFAFTPATRAAQDADRKNRKDKPDKVKLLPDWQPVVIPAPALAFGVALEGTALPGFKDWAWAHVKNVMRAQPVDPKGTIESVDRQYAAASDLARDAGIYLVYFFAYKDDDENQRTLALRIRDIDREGYEIGLQLGALSDTTHVNATVMTRKASGSTPNMAEIAASEQSLNARVRELRDEREIKVKQMTASRKKVNIYLKLMAAAYEKMQGTDPAVMRELK